MTNRRQFAGLIVFVTCLAAVGCGNRAENAPAEMHVAAAANLSGILGEIAKSFQSKTGIRVVPTMGPTAQLTQQIENGAPIDVFMAADKQHVDELVSKGFAEAESESIYARGRLVLWAPLHPEITSLRDLAGAKVSQVGCARPELAPYGEAAVEALQRQGLWKEVEPKLVYAQSISAAKQFADSGNTAAAFTALSLVYPTTQHYILVNESLHHPIDQALCIVSHTSQAGAARQFRDFVLSEEGRAIFARYGYSTTS